jgi:hypothetical protein
MYSRPAGEASSKMYKNLKIGKYENTMGMRSNPYGMPSRYFERAAATS